MVACGATFWAVFQHGPFLMGENHQRVTANTQLLV